MNGNDMLEIDEDNADTRYVLTEWGCLCSVLSDYGIDISRITGKVGSHIVEDFMDLLCKSGYVTRHDE